jgi:hypothetical protein
MAEAGLIVSRPKKNRSWACLAVGGRRPSTVIGNVNLIVRERPFATRGKLAYIDEAFGPVGARLDSLGGIRWKWSLLDRLSQTRVPGEAAGEPRRRICRAQSGRTRSVAARKFIELNNSRLS